MRAEDGGIYRKSNTRDFNKRYYLAFEGFTEYQYFHGLKMRKNNPTIAIPSSIDIQCLSRYDQNAGDSNPLNIERTMVDYRNLIRTGTYSVPLFVYTLIQDVYDILCQSLPKSRRRGCTVALHNLQSNLISQLAISDYTVGNYVKETDWEDATTFCRQLIEQSNFKGCGKYISVPKNRKVETYDEDVDAFCLIVDRDRESNSKKQYSQLIGSCEQQSIDLYVSNPCFEFWLMLHFNKTLKMAENEYDNILANTKQEVDGVRKSYCERKLIELLNTYSKTEIKFEQNFMSKVNTAIENAESFETTLNGLENHLGSNIGHLITEMKNANRKR